MKACKICGLSKPYDRSQKYCSKASGFYGLICWACHLNADAKHNAALRATPEGSARHKAAAARYSATPEGRARYNAAGAKRRSTEEGQAKNNAASLAWAKKYPEKANAASVAWAKKNPAKNAAKRAKYYAAKLQRIPPWADLGAIKQVYVEAQQKGLHVDHIYPLRGTLVSGLHVENNLQLLTQAANSSKGNQMPK